MRQFLLSLTFLFSFQGFTQLNNWDPSWYATDSALVFHDDLDFYLNAYTKKEIKKMRKQVRIWRMNFDKLMRQTIRELRTYSEGGGMVFGGVGFGCVYRQRHRHQQGLAGEGSVAPGDFHAFVEDAFVRGVQIHQHQAVAVFREDIGALELRQGEAERGRVPACR